MSKIIRVLGISGSLRAKSCNTGLLRAAASQLPEGMEFEFADVSQIPFYNADLQERPAAVDVFFKQLEQADALLDQGQDLRGVGARVQTRQHGVEPGRQPLVRRGWRQELVRQLGLKGLYLGGTLGAELAMGRDTDGQRQGQLVGGEGAQHEFGRMGLNHGLAPLALSVSVMPAGGGT